MLEFLNNLNSYLSRDFFKVSQKMKELADKGINDRDLTLLEELKFIKKLQKIYSTKLGNFPDHIELQTIDQEILYIFNKLELYPSNEYSLLNEHIELIQHIHETAYSIEALKKFTEFCEINNIPYLDEFKNTQINKSKNIQFIKFFILATLFTHIDVVINKQLKHIQPICLNELFRYRLNPLTTEIQSNKVIFHNKKSKFLLPTRQFLKFLSLWQNFESTIQKFPLKTRGLKLKPMNKSSPYFSKINELLRNIENTSDLLPIYYEDVPILLTGYSPQNIRFEEAASEISDNFQFHILSIWLIYIFQNSLGSAYKNNKEIPVTTLWLDLWDGFLSLYDLNKNADHLIKWPTDFMSLTKPID